MKKIIFLAAILFFGQVRGVGAELAGMEMTATYEVADKQAVDGDILISSGGDLKRSDIAYDMRMFGVLQKNPIVVFRSVAGAEEPVMRNGVAMVNVANTNGVIKKGDFITNSAVPGKGQKADKSGYALGTAWGDLNGSEGKIPVVLKIEYTEISTARNLTRIFDVVGNIFFKDVREPGKFTEIMRNIVAGMVVLTSFIFAFITFGRSLPKAIEAIGRNPLARNFIYLSILSNIGLVVGVLILGVGAAVLILRIQ